MRRLNYPPGSLKSKLILFLIIITVVAVDQLTKLWVTSSLFLGESRPEEGILRLTHVANEGVIFGISMPQPLALVFPILLVIAAIFLFFRYTVLESGFTTIGLGLVVGGSIGNLIDRFRLGHVTDFIDLRLWGDYHWPAFNVADSAIVVGTVMIVFCLVRIMNALEQG